MTPADRIRVYIAGDIHPTRGLVRRFLEDDGYAVVGTTISRKTMMAAIRRSEPDAVVVDEDLLVSGPGGGTLAKIREAVPDAKVIVFTAAPAADASGQPAADGYLEKGVGLAALSALLGRLFADETARLESLAAVGVGAPSVGAAASAGLPRERVAAAASNGNGAGTAARVVAIASGAILVVWGMIAMLATGGGPTPPPLDRTEGNGDGNVVFVSALDDAYASLRGLIGAIESGNYVLANVEAEALLDARERAREQGYAITALDALDADIRARLTSVVDLLPLRVNTTLSSILGVLYPELPNETVPGGGSDIVIGPVLTGDTGTGGDVVTGGDGTGGDGTGGDGTGGDGTGGDGGGNGGGSGGGDGGGTSGGEGPASLGPGDGRAWGQSHKPSHAGPGAPPAGGGPPPWANGNANGRNR